MKDKKLEALIKQGIEIYNNVTVEIVGLTFYNNQIIGVNKEYPEHYIKINMVPTQETNKEEV